MVFYGQIIVGPPGAGKTTYCQGMANFMSLLGRKCSVVNLDFANESLPYQCAIDVRELVSLERVMEEFELGPNGGLVYCMEYLLEHSEWLEEKIAALAGHYLIFDSPGQVELFTHHTCVQDLLKKLKPLDLRLSSVHLIDAFYCCEPSTFISAVLLVASTMLRLGLPHINVLSKIDLLPLYGPMPFKLDFYTELVDLMPLCRYIESPFAALKEGVSAEDAVEEDDDSDSDELEGDSQKHAAGTKTILQKKFLKMTEGLCDVLSDFGLVSFLPMNIQDSSTVARVLAAIDKANGYSFGADAISFNKDKAAKARAGELGSTGIVGSGNEPVGEKESLNRLFRLASQELESTYSRSLDIIERYELATESAAKRQAENESN